MFAPTGVRQAVVTLVVVGPGRASSDPTALDAAHRTVDVEHLQRLIDARARQIHGVFQLRGGHRLVTERPQQLLNHRLLRHGHGREVLPHTLILRAGQQHHLGVVGGAPGAADLLVIAHRRARRAQVHHEAEVRLVKAHAERRCGHQGFELVVDQRLLEALALLRLRAAGVGGHVPPGGLQRLRQVVRGSHGEAVDDAGALHLR